MADLTQYWACPHCKCPLERDEGGKSCYCMGTRRHCFDFAKSGYLNLRATHTGEGDGKDAIRARRSFLEAGYYAPLSERINGILEEFQIKSVLDAGCGEGYYTNRMAQDRDVLGVDLSKDGVDAAAKAAKAKGLSASYAVASLFTLPVQDASLDAVTNLFAPCAEEEFCRVLKQDGLLILVGAGERHLWGLKEVLYETPYLNQGREDLPQRMELIRTECVGGRINVQGREHIDALFSMTPYYWRTSPTDHAKLSSLETLETEIAFDIFLFRKGTEQ